MDAAPPALGARSKPAALLAVLRPHQWLKNAVVLAPLIFAHRLLVPGDVRRALVALVAYCALSSAGYVLNDLVDREADGAHPVKRTRPLAAGELTVAEGRALGIGLAIVGIALSLSLGANLALLAAAYLVLQYAYSNVLKRIVIVDVIAIALGFILRAYAGGVAIGLVVSQWLVLMTFLLALFLALARRRHELELLGPLAATHRTSLADYSLPLIDQMITIVTAATLVAYMVYSVSPEVAGRLGTGYFHLTVPFVVFGMFRYLYLVHRHAEGEDPAWLLLHDGPLRLAVAAWILVDLLLLYG